MKYTVEEYQGKLAVVTDWEPHFSKPIEYRLWWPVSVQAINYPQFIGKPATDTGTGSDGVFNVLIGSYDHRSIRLDNGGKTQPVHKDERPAEKPRKGKNYDWEWQNGKWEKHYK